MSTPKIWKVLEDNPFLHSSTFGGNPLACAAGIAAINVMLEENLAQLAAEKGKYLMKRLSSLQALYPEFLKVVRGKGLLIGVELHPEAGGARRFCEMLMTKGLLCKETHENTVRFAPPLVIKREDIDWALERIEPVLLSR